MTQKSYIKSLLQLNGQVSRNDAIYNFRCNGHHITRLSAVILELRKEGMKIKTIETKKDCVYVLEVTDEN